MVKVYNKGTVPIVYAQNHNGTFVIHPNKYQLLHKDHAEKLMQRFENAVDEKTFLGQPQEKKPVRKKVE